MLGITKEGDSKSHLAIVSFIYFAALSTILTSCFTSKPVQYLGGSIDTSYIGSYTVPEPVVKKGDILGITIYSDNPTATAIFNQASSGEIAFGKGNASSVSSQTGYLVDNDGNIRLHAIGKFNVEGLTKKEIETKIIYELEKMRVLTNPYCVVRNNNFRITVLGEVGMPGVITLPSEKANIFEAIGLVGDISNYGRKDQVLLVRESMGKRTYASINLTDPNIFASPYFYLQQNDLLIVQADKRKPTVADQNTIQYITLGFSLVSTIAILVTIFR